jgi:hypothetical protein
MKAILFEQNDIAGKRQKGVQRKRPFAGNGVI